MAAESGLKACADRLVEILKEETSGIASHTTGERFLWHFVTKYRFDGSVDVSFDREAVERVSIFGHKTAYMPYIINNPWSYHESYRGVDRHGREINTVTRWPWPGQNGFIRRAAARLRREYPNIRIRIDEEYR
jgi:hypothetical protein